MSEKISQPEPEPQKESEIESVPDEINFEKDSERKVLDEQIVSEEETQKELEEELSSEIIEEIMEKVVDLGSPENEKTLSVHSMGYPAGSVLGGLFNVEKLLNSGIVSQDLAGRKKIKISPFGYRGWHKVWQRDQSKNWDDSVYADSVSDVNQKGWSLLLKLPAEYTGIGDVIYKKGRKGGGKKIKRIKPQNIVGMVIDKNILDENIEDYLTQNFNNNSNEPKRVASQLLYLKDEFNLQVPTDLQEPFTNFLEDNKRLFAEDLFKTKKWREFEKNCIEIINILLPVLISTIKKDKRFENIKTFGDYLTELSGKFKLPVYSTDKELLAPKQMNYEGVKKFVGERESSSAKATEDKKIKKE